MGWAGRAPPPRGRVRYSLSKETPAGQGQRQRFRLRRFEQSPPRGARRRVLAP